MKRAVAFVLALTIGLAGGALGTVMVQGAPAPSSGDPVTRFEAIATGNEVPTTFLAWIPRGIPGGFVGRVRALPVVDDVTVVAEGIAWLTRSWSAAGELVDHPPRRYRIPIDTAAVSRRGFATFLPPADRASMTSVANGEGILGASAAGLRGLGPGAVLDVGGERIGIAAVLPDERVGAAELVVSRRTGRRIGITSERYLLIRGDRDAQLSSRRLRAVLRPLLPATLGINRVIQVRAPGDTPFFRAGDAVLPLVMVKTLFGEFAARPRPGVTGELIVDPAWVRANIVTTEVPLLGRVTCHRGILDQLRDAMRALDVPGGDGVVRSYHGCFVPRFIAHDPANMLSYHSWGIAFDLNLPGNWRGVEPRQPPRLLASLLAAGFQWGGSWIVPDGSHFEYRRAPAG